MARLPDLEAWSIFARVAELGSFSGAAAEIGLSTATVSKAIGRLEARVGGALFHRTSRRLSLTVLGRGTAERASRLLAEAEAIEADALAETATPRGTVRVAAPMSFGQRHVAPLLPDLLHLYPELRVELELSDHHVDLVAEGFDIALRIATLDSSSLRVRHVCPVRLLLVAAPDYAARHPELAHPRDLDPADCARYVYRLAARWNFIGPEGEQVLVTPEGRFMSNNAEVTLPLVYAGLAVAVLPDFMVWQDLRDGRLVELLPRWKLPASALNLLTPPGGFRPPRVTATMDFFHKRLSATCLRAKAAEGA
ncbi:LysR family transcriptional regulator [Rhizosaccharibacter radicis]|uniref:LysR family transcriptional regulator n=1 Tax=Rhizosaccharibacter radicis TaxID=2782605 RepID=A0ABT1VWR9_9PROT|nr:LysR family transcriptional regulator [Acetobacteraceae bacterium KSS12]